MPRGNLPDISPWLAVWVVYYITEDPSNYWKNEKESDKWCLNRWLEKMVFLTKMYTLYIQKDKIDSQNAPS
jgi:hypothetical protein